MNASIREPDIADRRRCFTTRRLIAASCAAPRHHCCSRPSQTHVLRTTTAHANSAAVLRCCTCWTKQAWRQNTFIRVFCCSLQLGAENKTSAKLEHARRLTKIVCYLVLISLSCALCCMYFPYEFLLLLVLDKTWSVEWGHHGLWFYVNRCIFREAVRQTIFTLLPQWPWPLTFWPQNCFASYSSRG